MNRKDGSKRIQRTGRQGRLGLHQVVVVGTKQKIQTLKAYLEGENSSSRLWFYKENEGLTRWS